MLCVILPVKSQNKTIQANFSLEAVIRHMKNIRSVKDGCITILAQYGDWVAMTNHTWAFSIAEMKKNLGFSHLEVINDFTAVVWRSRC